jgi:hypothetical protein
MAKQRLENLAYAVYDKTKHFSKQMKIGFLENYGYFYLSFKNTVATNLRTTKITYGNSVLNAMFNFLTLFKMKTTTKRYIIHLNSKFSFLPILECI